jgi:MFS family permease
VAHRRARIGISIVFLVCGAGFATWAARVPAAQERLGLTEGELALGLFGLAAGSVLALLVAGALVTVLGSRRTSVVGASVLGAGLPAVAAAPDLGLFIAALAVLGVGNSLLDVAMNAQSHRDGLLITAYNLRVRRDTSEDVRRRLPTETAARWVADWLRDATPQSASFMPSCEATKPRRS